MCGSDFSGRPGNDHRKKIKLSNQEKPVVPPVAVPCPVEPLHGPSSLVSRKYKRSWSTTVGHVSSMMR